MLSDGTIKLIIISEYGEETKIIRTELTDILNNQKFFPHKQGMKFITGDIGLKIRPEYNDTKIAGLKVYAIQSVTKQEDYHDYRIIKERLNPNTGEVKYEV